MKFTYAAYQCHLFGTPIHPYFNPYCPATFSESEAACMVSTVKCWHDLTVQFNWDGIDTVGWPSG